MGKRRLIGFKLVGAGVDHGRVVIDTESVTAIEERLTGCTIYLRGAKGIQVTAPFETAFAAIFAAGLSDSPVEWVEE